MGTSESTARVLLVCLSVSELEDVAEMSSIMMSKATGRVIVFIFVNLV